MRKTICAITIAILTMYAGAGLYSDETVICPARWIGPEDTSATILSLFTTPYNAHTCHMGYYPGNGIMRPLITWDLSNLPSVDIEIVTANLTLYANQVVQGGPDYTVEVYGVLVDYAEMYCTWTNLDTTTLWGVPGMVGGSDVEAAPVKTFEWPYLTTPIVVDLKDAVQNWADGTWDNNGVLLKFADESDSTGPYYSITTNGSLVGQSGVIEVTYRVSDVDVSDTDVNTGIQFTSFPGYYYNIYWSETMNNWELANTIIATDYQTTWVDSGDTGRSPFLSPGVTKRFYKIENAQN